MKIRREIKIGLFALAALVCLYLGVNYLKGKDVFSNDRTYHVLFDQTGGLRTNAPVLLRGVKVGTVTEITFDERHPDKVTVDVAVKKSVPIPVDSRIKLFPSDLMGSKALEIVSGVSTSYFEKYAVIPSETEAGFLEIASVRLGDLIAEARAMVQSIDAAVGNVNSLLDDNAQSITGALQNIEQFSAVLKSNSGRLESIVANLDKVTGDVAEVDLKATLDTLGQSVGHLNVLFAKLSSGGGTAGKLLDDPALYDSLTVAVGNLSVLLEDLKANPGRYVHFSMFGGNKEKKEKPAKEKKKR